MKIVLPEIVSVGIYNSQIEVKNKSITKNRKTTMFEIEIPIGEGGISYINSEKMPISENMIICAKPGQIRHTKLPFKCYYIHIIVREGLLYNILADTPNFIITKNFNKYQDIFVKICKCYDTTRENDNIMLNALILELIYELGEERKKYLYKYAMKNNNYQIIEKAIEYIKENLMFDLTLKTVADYVALSPVYFHNCFKASTGKTLHEYVEEQRMSNAINMLLTTNQTLTEIAYQCGFSSQSYFSYVFKRKMKMTPREYAKEIYRRYDTNPV